MYGTKNFQKASKNPDRHWDRDVYSVDVDDELYNSFKSKATENNTTMNALMVKWVDEYLKENETKTE